MMNLDWLFHATGDVTVERWLLALGEPPAPGVSRRTYILHMRRPRWVAQVLSMTDHEACRATDPEQSVVILNDRWAVTAVRTFEPVPQNHVWNWQEVCEAIERLSA